MEYWMAVNCIECKQNVNRAVSLKSNIPQNKHEHYSSFGYIGADWAFLNYFNFQSGSSRNNF